MRASQPDETGGQKTLQSRYWQFASSFLLVALLVVVLVAVAVLVVVATAGRCCS